MRQEYIRNFVIIAHIDHGKSTLADRFLEITGTVEKRFLREQFLDQMELERERGITIKMQPVRMAWQFAKREYTLNLIDTPGHVDFSYEVSRSLAAVEGAILLVDATQDIQAQTLANFRMAEREGLVMIGALTKMDLQPPHADAAAQHLAGLLHQNPSDILRISGKTGEGVRALLDTIVTKIAPPQGEREQPFRALIFDSHYDPYKGVIAYVKIVDGNVKQDDQLYLHATGENLAALEVGIFTPALKATDVLASGEIGYIATGIKEPGKVRVGDTFMHQPTVRSGFVSAPLAGYQEPKPVVFASFYPRQAEDLSLLKDSLEKLKLNDAALSFVPIRQEMLGQGFRIGFLGMLHLEITKERLSREFGLEPVITLPSVLYRATLRDNRSVSVHTPQELPRVDTIKTLEEPWAKGDIVTPVKFLNHVISLIRESEGYTVGLENFGEDIMIHFEIPLAQLIIDFYDRLKSISRGYASLSYEVADWRPGALVKVDILVAEEVVNAFSRIMPSHQAEKWGRATIEKLKELLPREVFPVPIQAAIGTTVIARVTMPALKKDVTGYLYGGDRTRKMKLWKKQTRGKKKLASRGKVEIPASTFFEVFKANTP